MQPTLCQSCLKSSPERRLRGTHTVAPPIAGDWQSDTEAHLAAKNQPITLISESFVLVFLDGFLLFMDGSENSPTELIIKRILHFWKSTWWLTVSECNAITTLKKMFFTSTDTRWQQHLHAAPEHWGFLLHLMFRYSQYDSVCLWSNCRVASKQDSITIMKPCLGCWKVTIPRVKSIHQYF